MALSAPRARSLASARVPKRTAHSVPSQARAPRRGARCLLLIGLAAAVGLGGVYVAVEDNPLANKQQPVASTTAPVTHATLQQIASAVQADRIGVQNAQRTLSNAQAAANNAADVVAATNSVAAKQVDQAQSSTTATGASVATSRAQQDLTSAQNNQMPSPT